MKINVDMKERINITFLFFLQSYKVLMGSMLIIFVPQSCGNNTHICSMNDIINDNSLLNYLGLSSNLVTTLIFMIYYLIELRRENLCIQYLDIDQNYGDNNLSNEINNYPFIKNKIITMNNLYYSSTITAMSAYAINLSISTVVIIKNYHSMATATSYFSFIILILMKLYNSYYISMDTKYNFNSLSAYMTEFQSFNVIDEDYRTKLKIKQINKNEFEVKNMEEGKKENTVVNPLNSKINLKVKTNIEEKMEEKNDLPKKKKNWGVIANLNLFS